MRPALSFPRLELQADGLAAPDGACGAGCGGRRRPGIVACSSQAATPASIAGFPRDASLRVFSTHTADAKRSSFVLHSSFPVRPTFLQSRRTLRPPLLAGMAQFCASRPGWRPRPMHEGLQLADSSPLEGVRRTACPRCERSNAYYCCDCLLPLTPGVPTVPLPFSLFVCVALLRAAAAGQPPDPAARAPRKASRTHNRTEAAQLVCTWRCLRLR